MHTPCRNGVFVPLELSDFPAFLRRLGRIHALFTAPHPLSKVAGQVIKETEEDSFFQGVRKECSIVSVETFHKTFLQYLVKNRFFSLLYHYLDSHRYANINLLCYPMLVINFHSIQVDM